MKLALGILALVLNIIGYIPYIRDIFRGKVKPQRITWGIWTILTTIAAVNQVKNGGGYSSLFFISTVILVATTFMLSLKRGMGGASLLDKVCLGLAIVLLPIGSRCMIRGFLRLWRSLLTVSVLFPR